MFIEQNIFCWYNYAWPFAIVILWCRECICSFPSTCQIVGAAVRLLDFRAVDLRSTPQSDFKRFPLVFLICVGGDTWALLLTNIPFLGPWGLRIKPNQPTNLLLNQQFIFILHSFINVYFEVTGQKVKMNDQKLVRTKWNIGIRTKTKHFVI